MACPRRASPGGQRLWPPFLTPGLGLFPRRHTLRMLVETQRAQERTEYQEQNITCQHFLVINIIAAVIIVVITIIITKCCCHFLFSHIMMPRGAAALASDSISILPFPKPSLRAETPGAPLPDRRMSVRTAAFPSRQSLSLMCHCRGLDLAELCMLNKTKL